MKKDRAYYRNLTWSKYQRDIFTEVLKRERHIAAEAKAGAGKTTTLKGIVHWLPSDTKIRIFAFNKSVADKLKRELPSRVKVGTAHSYGLAMCMGATGAYNEGMNVDEDKYFRLVHAAIGKLIRQSEENRVKRTEALGRYPNMRDERVVREIKEGALTLCHFIRVTLPEFRFNGVREMIETYNLNIASRTRYWAIKIAMDCIVQGNQQASEKRLIDYDDMLWLPHIWRRRPLGKVDIIAVDEAQDTTAASQSLYRKFIEDGAQGIFVGDTRQGINFFAGSMPDAFPVLKTEFNCKEMPLPVSYRCPISHIALAQQIVPDIEWKEGAFTGSLGTRTRQDMLDNAKIGDAVLCRITAPLLLACIELILKGKPAKIRGKEIGEQFAKLALDIGSDMPFRQFKLAVEMWRESSLIEPTSQDDNYAIDNINDQALALIACYDAFGANYYTILDFANQIKVLFCPDETEGIIILSTIHRFKGDEAPTVWLINSDDLPPERDDLNQETQEENLVYVGITRALENLYFVPERPCYDNVGGISILMDVDFNLLPNVEAPTVQTSEQLALFV